MSRKHLERVIHTEAVFASILGNLVKVPGKIGVRQKIANYEAKNLPISFFSWMNLTLANDSAASSIACNGENSVKKRYLAGMPTWQMCDDIQNLIEAILATVGDIHKFDNLGLEVARVGLCPKYAPGNLNCPRLQLCFTPHQSSCIAHFVSSL